MSGLRELAVFWAVSALLSACAAQNVSVVRMQLPFMQQVSFSINRSVEYILDAVPSGDEGEWPGRVWVRVAGGDAARPVLLTVRQRTGAVTWQLPYRYGDLMLHELERTLCPDDGDIGADAGADSDCVGGAGDIGFTRGAFSLHVSSACAAPLTVSARVDSARDAKLYFETDAFAVVTLTAPRVHYYRFPEAQRSVRFVVASDDDVCASVVVHNYTCPMIDPTNEMASGLRMTVQRSGAVQLDRSRYPLGFFVTSLVRASDEPCAGEVQLTDDWLWEAALFGYRDEHLHLARTKGLTITLKAALTRGQYAVATGVTLAIFLLFYVAFALLVLAQRWPRWAELVQPKAVLADTHDPALVADSEVGTETQVDSSATRDGARPRSRSSNATFDSSDNSDSDESDAPSAPSPAPAPAPTPASARTAADGPNSDAVTNGQQVVETATAATAADTAGSTPFGLPARLRLAALSRHRARTLRARSDRYLSMLYTVAVFYALPVVQFVAAFQIIFNMSGSLDICYYNFLCAHRAGELADFNHVFSNIGYLLLGALFMLQLRRRRQRRKKHPIHPEYGIPAHYGLLASLGAGMMVVALLSASYHVCPNRLNFQFDTAFMYVLAVLSMVKIYQSRHPDVNARAHATFAVLALLIALVVWGVLGGGPLFWGAFTVLHLFTLLLLSLRIYYVGQFRFEKESVATAAREIRSMPGVRGMRPLYTARLAMLLIANAVNWLLALYGLFTLKADFAGHLLEVLLCNTLLYMVFYLCMKLAHGERPRWYAWAFLAGAAAAWAPALYFFVSGSSDWSATPALSRHRNHECKVLQFYDSHDLWHMLSAVALYLSFNAMLTWDDGLAAVKRTDIPVF